MGFLTGSKERWEQRSLLQPQQQPILNNLFQSAQNRGAGGSFGAVSDYYRDLLGGDINSPQIQAAFAPEQRYFQEQVIPDLAEQFAGMGSGALSSSGFRNSAVSAGTDLSERLGALRQQLRMQGAQGLSNLAQQSLGQYTQNVHRPSTEGFLGSSLGSTLGSVGTAIGGPVLGALGASAGSWIKNRLEG